MHPHPSNPASAVLLAMAFLLASCDKPKKLEAERMRLTAERQVVVDEIATYDKKSVELGKLHMSGDGSEMERNAVVILQQTAGTEKTAKENLQKWTQIESKFNALREQIAAYKAKNLH